MNIARDTAPNQQEQRSARPANRDHGRTDLGAAEEALRGGRREAPQEPHTVEVQHRRQTGGLLRGDRRVREAEEQRHLEGVREVRELPGGHL